ncbi:TPA: Bbp16 family capsid cement protein, partial [Raoultella ornithinolytica]
GKYGDIPLLIQVVESFNTLTSLTVTVQTDDNSAFSSATDVLSLTIPLASLVQGYKSPVITLPMKLERYIRLNYTVTGTAPTAGKVTAGITGGVQTNA